MLPQTAAQAAERNTLHGGGPWVLLAEIQWPDGEITRFARNPEPVVYAGEIFAPCHFEYGKIRQGAPGEHPQITCTISNIGNAVGAELEPRDGAVGAVVVLRWVHGATGALLLDASEWDVRASSISEEFATLELGGARHGSKRFPRNLWLKNHCPYDRVAQCPNVLICDHTLRNCRELGYTNNFGGAPTVGFGGVYA